MAKLNDKRERFAQEYMRDLNATQAAIRAGYSSKTAKSQGQRLLTFVDVDARIEELKEERAERTRVDSDRVLKEIARVGFSNMRSYVSWDSRGLTMCPSEELSEDDAAAVTHVKFTPGEFGDTVEIKLGHKDSALRMLAQHTGLLDHKSDDTGKLADTFLAGAETVRKMQTEVPDLSER